MQQHLSMNFPSDHSANTQGVHRPSLTPSHVAMRQLMQKVTTLSSSSPANGPSPRVVQQRFHHSVAHQMLSPQCSPVYGSGYNTQLSPSGRVSSSPTLWQHHRTSVQLQVQATALNTVPCETHAPHTQQYLHPLSNNSSVMYNLQENLRNEHKFIKVRNEHIQYSSTGSPQHMLDTKHKLPNWRRASPKSSHSTGLQNAQHYPETQSGFQEKQQITGHSPANLRFVHSHQAQNKMFQIASPSYSPAACMTSSHGSMHRRDTATSPAPGLVPQTQVNRVPQIKSPSPAYAPPHTVGNGGASSRGFHCSSQQRFDSNGLFLYPVMEGTLFPCLYRNKVPMTSIRFLQHCLRKRHSLEFLEMAGNFCSVPFYQVTKDDVNILNSDCKRTGFTFTESDHLTPIKDALRFVSFVEHRFQESIYSSAAESSTGWVKLGSGTIVPYVTLPAIEGGDVIKKKYIPKACLSNSPYVHIMSSVRRELSDYQFNYINSVCRKIGIKTRLNKVTQLINLFDVEKCHSISIYPGKHAQAVSDLKEIVQKLSVTKATQNQQMPNVKSAHSSPPLIKQEEHEQQISEIEEKQSCENRSISTLGQATEIKVTPKVVPNTTEVDTDLSSASSRLIIDETVASSTDNSVVGSTSSLDEIKSICRELNILVDLPGLRIVQLPNNFQHSLPTVAGDESTTGENRPNNSKPDSAVVSKDDLPSKKTLPVEDVGAVLFGTSQFVSNKQPSSSVSGGNEESAENPSLDSISVSKLSVVKPTNTNHDLRNNKATEPSEQVNVTKDMAHISQEPSANNDKVKDRWTSPDSTHCRENTILTERKLKDIQYSAPVKKQFALRWKLEAEADMIASPSEVSRKRKLGDSPSDTYVESPAKRNWKVAGDTVESEAQKQASSETSAGLSNSYKAQCSENFYSEKPGFREEQLILISECKHSKEFKRTNQTKAPNPPSVKSVEVNSNKELLHTPNSSPTEPEYKAKLVKFQDIFLICVNSVASIYGDDFIVPIEVAILLFPQVNMTEFETTLTTKLNVVLMELNEGQKRALCKRLQNDTCTFTGNGILLSTLQKCFSSIKRHIAIKNINGD